MGKRTEALTSKKYCFSNFTLRKQYFYPKRLLLGVAGGRGGEHRFSSTLIITRELKNAILLSNLCLRVQERFRCCKFWRRQS